MSERADKLREWADQFEQVPDLFIRNCHGDLRKAADKLDRLGDAASAALQAASVFSDQWGPDEREAFEALRAAL